MNSRGKLPPRNMPARGRTEGRTGEGTIVYLPGASWHEVEGTIIDSRWG